MQREDTLPWYRQFWPWFIIALPASAVVAGLYTVWLAMQTTDSLVISSNAGVDVTTARNLLAEQDAVRQQLSADIELNDQTGAVIVTLQSKYANELPDALQMRLRHPTIAARDVATTLLRGISDEAGNARYSGHFATPPEGRFFVTIAAGDEWRLSGEWSGQQRTLLTAQPGNEQH